MTIQIRNAVQPLAQAQGTTFSVQSGPLSTLPPNTIVVSFPMTLEMDIVRGVQSSANMGHFRIFNLASDKRRQIHHDRTDTNNYQRVTIWAGYEQEKKLSLIFQGNILKASSYRQGPDWITDIEAYSGMFGIQNAVTSVTLPAGWKTSDVIRQVIGSMMPFNVSVGAIGNISQELNARGVTLAGPAWDIIQNIAPTADTFIDNEEAFVLDQFDYVIDTQGIRKIDSSSGLLQTPRRFDGRLDIPVLFEPEVQVGQAIDLVSAESVYNGRYKVSGVRHSGTISGAIGGELITTVTAFTGSKVLSGVNPD